MLLFICITRAFREIYNIIHSFECHLWISEGDQVLFLSMLLLLKLLPLLLLIPDSAFSFRMLNYTEACVILFIWCNCYIIYRIFRFATMFWIQKWNSFEMEANPWHNLLKCTNIDCLLWIYKRLIYFYMDVDTKCYVIIFRLTGSSRPLFEHWSF